MQQAGDSVQEKVSSALGMLDAWLENENFQGWDPHDALNSPFLKALSFEKRLPGIFWVQLLKRLPLNLRPLLGVPKGYNPKGMGLFLSSYLRKFQMTGNGSYKERITFFSKWLRENIIIGYSGACWGYNFDWPNRGFFAPKGTPTIINTAFIGLAFLDIYRVLGDENALSVARSACDFILEDLNIFRNVAELCFSYTPLDQRYIHNANLVGAQLLAEVYAVTGEKNLADHARAAALYSSRRQLSDGSWWYGEEKKEQWIDNFHTGFVLVSLRKIAANLGQDVFLTSVENGYKYWKDNFFLDDGTPKYFHQKIYPIDVHCLAQALLTYLEFRDIDSEGTALALREAKWGIVNMQSSDGYFHYQIYPYHRIRIPYIRWSQAWMQRALTELVYVQNTPTV